VEPVDNAWKVTIFELLEEKRIDQLGPTSSCEDEVKTNSWKGEGR
jgi:hypothetical protein